MKMKIIELIERQGKSISFEFFPPKTKEDEDRLFEMIGKLEALNPTFVSVTYGAGGSTARNTRLIVKRIKEETPLIVMPHLTCIGQSEDELKALLEDYRKLGIKNILALRGDPPQGKTMSDLKNGMCYATDLVKQVASMKDFSIAVAVYPEGHCESPNLEMDMVYTKQKIDAGADFAITQMYFDNRYFYKFLDRAEKIGIHIPIIPGIMPVTDIRKIKRFTEICGATLPPDLIQKMEGKAPEEARKIGIEFATRQIGDLWDHGIRYFHFYTLNRSDVVTEILHNLALDKEEMLVTPA